jgi:hypothetical protein
MLLDLRSRDVYILLTDTKALRSTRVPMGSKNSTAALGRATSVILADLLHELAIYADDCAGGKAEPEDLLNLASKFLKRCEAFRFYVTPAKLQLIVEELVWLGRLLRGGKLLRDPSYVAGVTALHKPADAGLVAACDAREIDKTIAAWQLRPVAFFGGVFNKTELAWSVPEKEVVAQVRTMQKAQHRVDRPQPFFALVDALAMVKVAEMGDTAASEPNHVRAGRIQRWAAFLDKFNAIVVHVPGELNLVADYASRHVAPTAQGEEALAEAGALQPNEAATAPQVNNSEAASESESETETETEPGTGDVKQDAVADLYDYRKARVTPLDWPAYKWPSIPDLVEDTTRLLEGSSLAVCVDVAATRGFGTASWPPRRSPLARAWRSWRHLSCRAARRRWPCARSGAPRRRSWWRRCA